MVAALAVELWRNNAAARPKFHALKVRSDFGYSQLKSDRGGWPSLRGAQATKQSSLLKTLDCFARNDATVQQTQIIAS
jgi:hypothetical protein